jgi:Na+:H+ antiporter, NhaA family
MKPVAARSPFARFFAHESAGGMVLAVAAVAALAISNSPWRGVYEAWLAMPGELRVGQDFLVLSKPLVVWVNDLWMAVFFFLVGLEIKREFVEGELATKRQALLPVVAAFGGMAVPALIYAFINRADAVALRGWAIPSATDIAFALGILLLLGSRVPASLKVFLTAVAIIDDLGAIVIIALFYTDKLSALALGGAGVGVALLVLLNRLRVMRVDLYVLVGLLVWVCVLKSGVHATLAGVITALAVPARNPEGGSPLQNVEHALHPWVVFVVLPVFAFCNAGVSLEGVTLATLLQPVPLGITLGLLVGKAVGVFGSTWLLVRSGVADRPAGATWWQVFGVSVLCGIGFTMSLFIGGLAFEGQGPGFELQLKIGVLGGSLLSGVAGALLLVWAARRGTPSVR